MGARTSPDRAGVAGRVSGRWAVVGLGWLLAAGLANGSGDAQADATRPGVQAVPRPADVAPLGLPRLDDRALPTPPALPRQLVPADDLRVDVLGYTVDDPAPPALRAALARLTAPYTGPGRTWEDLVNAAEDASRFLVRELGYYLPYVYIPEQQPDDGRVRLAVLEGRLDEVQLRWPTTPMPVQRAVVQGYLDVLRPGSVLMERDIERVVFLVNDLRGMTARVDVQPGRSPGTATLVVTPRAEPVHSGRLDLDLNGSRFLATQRAGGLWSWNSPSGAGDALSLTALASRNGALLFVLAGYNRPVGRHGLKWGGSLSVVNYRLDAQEFPLGAQGQAYSTTAYLLYPALRSRNVNAFVLGSYEHKRNTDQRKKNNFTEHRVVDVLTLGVTGDLRDNLLRGGVNSFDISAAWGQLRYPQGFPADTDVAPQFTKLAFSATRLQNLVEGRLLLSASVRGQRALANLDTGEQFRLGGPDALRALAPGEGTGDSGWLLSSELRLLPPERWLGRLARELVFSAFYDGGRITLRQAPRPQGTDPLVDNVLWYSGAGLGLTWARGSEMALRVSLSKPLAGVPRSDRRVRDPRLYAQFSAGF